MFHYLRLPEDIKNEDFSVQLINKYLLNVSEKEKINPQ
jgi:hypothetical protein